MEQLTCDPLDALNEALCHEREGQQFYVKATSRTIDPKGQAMFRSLAEDAQQHIQIIQHQIEAFEKDTGWSLPECVFDCKVDLDRPLYPRGKKALEAAVALDDSDLDALLFAIKTENDSFDLYARHARTSGDGQARSFYEYLAEEARAHFDMLLLNYESLNDESGWV